MESAEQRAAEPSASALHDRDIDDGITPADLERVMQVVPQGALALAGTAIVLLMLCWLAIYFLIFLPRGSVG